MVRIKNPKAKGSQFERIVKKIIQKHEPNTEVFRSPASLGSADLITIKRYSGFTKELVSNVGLIQCKYLRKYMSKKDSVKLCEDAVRIGAEAFLVYREKPRGDILFENLTTEPHSPISVKSFQEIRTFW